jgi:lincosamide nucleotidyltransferase A/C/D/E
MDAASVLAALDRLAAHGIDVWLDGGWCVDALLDEQTRPHDDLDVVASLDNATSLEAALSELGYEPAGGGLPTHFELVDQVGHQVDVHPVTFVEEGGRYRMGEDRFWTYPAAGFSGSGTILGCGVPCLTPEVMLVCHSTGYELHDVHERDVLRLCERFGLPVPTYRRAG